MKTMCDESLSIYIKITPQVWLYGYHEPMIYKHHIRTVTIINAIWNTRVNKIKEDRLTDTLSFFGVELQVD